MTAQKPVEWKAWASQVSPGAYTLHVTGTILKGWHAYASADSSLDLEPLTITWENGNIIKEENTNQNSSDFIVYRDPVFNNRNVKVYKNEINLAWNIKVDGLVPSLFSIRIRGFASNDKEFVSIDESKDVVLAGCNQMNDGSIKRSSIVLTKPINNCGDDGSHDKGLLAIFFLGVIGGLFALLTPCVFPMLPVTVSFFMGKSKSRSNAIKNGVLYGAFIFMIYLAASVPFHLVKGIDKNIFNSIATNAWVNVGFFIVFVLFSLSFFGLFEISLPGSAATKTDARSNLSTVPGIFFMALTLAIVSFSCTGVILGVLLANIAANGPWALTAGMAGFGLALALPFALFAIFPNLLKSLPKSGSWLNTVKKGLAFVELALAFKFLSNADLVEHWGLLKREIFIGIWLLITLALSLYLLGLFERKRVVVRELQNADRLKKERPEISYGRKGLGILTLFFAIYLVPGITKTKEANLKLLSGFPPPLSHSIYGKENVTGKALEPKIINDYDTALQLAKKEGKPLLIDFTGWACVNCRKMEENVWTKPEIQQTINDQFILVSLYVDDRKPLPGSQQVSYKNADGEVKLLKTVGDKWAAFQEENFRQVTQPLYVVLSPDELLLNHPVGYTPDKQEYKDWLECGLNAFQKEKNTVINK